MVIGKGTNGLRKSVSKTGERHQQSEKKVAPDDRAGG